MISFSPRAAAGAPATSHAASILILALACLACGHRGDPRPPVYPQPPPLRGLEVSQRGTSAVLRFPRPPPAAAVRDETVEVAILELLVYAERYPVIDPVTMIAALERQRDLYVEEAAAEEARAAAARQREAEEQAAAAGQPPTGGGGTEASDETPEAQAPAGVDRPTLSPEEELLRRVPQPTLRDWRQAGITADTILKAAGQLAAAVADVWDRLRLPKAVIDPQRPPGLPEPGEIVAAAEAVLAKTRYERQIEPERFRQRAAPHYRISYDEADELRVGTLVQLIHPVGIPSPGTVRTRYHFGLRAISARGRAGDVEEVVLLTPTPVPLEPTSVAAGFANPAVPIVAPSILPVVVGSRPNPDPGVELTWTAPPGDLWGRLLPQEAIRYNVYRASRDGEPSPEPINGVPIDGTRFIDRTMDWGRAYVYEIRALQTTGDEPAQGNVPEITPGRDVVRESSGARTEPVRAVDIFYPAAPTDLQVARAGGQVTLQWSPSAAADLRGYRVYRHAMPAPALPKRAPARRRGTRRLEDERTEEQNPMIELGWQLLTPEPITLTRYFDTEVDASVRYAYAVEAVDRSGNTSDVVRADEPERPRP